MTTNVALYEALKPYVGEKAAEMIAEVFPAAKDLATKADLIELEARLTSRMLAFFIPLWVGMTGMVVAVVALVFRV